MHAVAPAIVDDDPNAHTAPHDELIDVVRDLMRTAPGGVTLDQLANGLRERGFRRTPGSPRLITRLKRIKELDVNRSGLIRVVDEQPSHTSAAARDADVEPIDIEPSDDDANGSEEAEAAPAEAGTAEGGQRRRRRRRGGRRRRGRRGGGGSSANGETGGEVIAASAAPPFGEVI
jgi:hypothetical protein